MKLQTEQMEGKPITCKQAAFVMKDASVNWMAAAQQTLLQLTMALCIRPHTPINHPHC